MTPNPDPKRRRSARTKATRARSRSRQTQPAQGAPVKKALVVSGGGSKGAFAVGAIDVLRAHGIGFDLVTGTSTGALIAPLVAIDDIPLLRQIYSTVRTEDILVRRGGIDILAGDAIHDTRPLWRLINAHMTQARYQRVLASAMDVFVCATNLQDGKAYYFNPKRGRDGRPLSRDTFNRAIFASASQPVLMPAIRVPYREGDQYVDGGLREVAPLRKAIEEGASEIYAIVLSPAQHRRREEDFVSIFDTLLRTLDVLLTEIAAGDVNEAATTNELLTYLQLVRERAAPFIPSGQLEQVFRPTPGMQKLLTRRLLGLHVIRPAEELPSDGLEFSPPIMLQMMEMGRAAAEALLAGG